MAISIMLNNAADLGVGHSNRVRLLVFVLVLGLLLVGVGKIAAFRLAQQSQPPGRLVDVGGYAMHINCVGTGNPTVLLEAGLEDFSIFWALVQPEVAKFTRVCAYDRVGYGWSEPSQAPRTSETMVDELHTLLTGAEIAGPYVLVGHSFGGALVRLYAHKYPADVAAMVLVDAAPDALFTRVPAWRQAYAGLLRLFRTLALLRTSGLLALAPGAAPNRGLPDQAFAQYRAVLVTTPYFETSIAEIEAFEENLAEIHATVTDFGKTPLVVLSRGIWEPLPGLSESENQEAWQAWQDMQAELAALSSNGSQVVAEQSGHHIQLEQPQLVVEAIQQVWFTTER